MKTLMIIYGSQVFLVVRTIIVPSRTSNSAFRKFSPKHFSINGQHSLKHKILQLESHIFFPFF